jgi:hypothetical protein
MDCIEEVMGTFSISCKFIWVLDQLVWAISVVYGPSADSEIIVGGAFKGF